MNNQIHDTGIVIFACIVLILAICMLLEKTPNQLISSNYRAARRIMGVAFSIIPFAVLLYFLFGMRQVSYAYRVGYNISIYYIVVKMVIFSLITLVSERSTVVLRKLKWGYITNSIYPIAVWSTILLIKNDFIDIDDIAMGVMLIMTIIDARFFANKGMEIVSEEDSFYAGDMVGSLKWVRPVIYGFLAIGIYSCVFFLVDVKPVWAIIIYMILVFVTFIFTFSRLMRHALVMNVHIDQLNALKQSKTDNDKVKLSAEVYQHIKMQLGAWLKSKGFCDSSVSLQGLSTQFLTNRQYLSTYINARYNCSFRIWIAKLRIEEAKRILMKSPDVKITEVSTKVGFRSIASFTHSFTFFEGVPPKRWMRDITIKK